MPKRYICTKCEYVGMAAKKKRGSTGADVFGGAVFPLGIPYTLWRMFTKIPVCKACGHHPLVEEESMIGQKMLEKIYGLLPELEPVKKPICTRVMETPPERTTPKRDKSIPRPEDNPQQF